MHCLVITLLLFSVVTCSEVTTKKTKEVCQSQQLPASGDVSLNPRYRRSIFGTRLDCETSGCCGQRVDALKKDCVLIIPFVAAILSYLAAYAVGQYSSSSVVGCSSTVTSSKTLVMVEFSTVTGTVTSISVYSDFTFATSFSTVYTPSFMFTTTTATATLTTTPTTILVMTEIVTNAVTTTFVTCTMARAVQELRYESLIEQDTDLVQNIYQEVQGAEYEKLPSADTRSQHSDLNPSFDDVSLLNKM